MPKLKNDNFITLHVNVNKQNIELFDKMYASCRRRFVNNAIELAVNDKNFFDRIFFKDLLNT